MKYNSAKEWGVHVLNAVFVTDILYGQWLGKVLPGGWLSDVFVCALLAEGSIPDVHPYHTDLNLEDDLEVNHPYCLLLLGEGRSGCMQRAVCVCVCARVRVCVCVCMCVRV